MKASKTTGRKHEIVKSVKSEKDIKKLVATEIIDFDSIKPEPETIDIFKLSQSEVLALAIQTENFNLLWDLHYSKKESASNLNKIRHEEVCLLINFIQLGLSADTAENLIDTFYWYFVDDLKHVLRSVDIALSHQEAMELCHYCRATEGEISIELYFLWWFNVPEQHHKKVKSFVRSNWNNEDLMMFFEEVIKSYNLSLIGDLEFDILLSLEFLRYVFEFVDSLQTVNCNDPALYQIIIWHQLNKRKQHKTLTYSKLESMPIWCDEEVWDLFNEEKAYKGAEIIHQIKDELIKQYPPNNHLYVCMARDAVPLYVLLFESGFDCMLGVFSRSQIGDQKSIDLLKDEIEYSKNVTGKLPILVDIQGRGTIYDHLKENDLDYPMIFGVCSHPDICRYPLLINDSEIGRKAIRKIEKLPQNNGRAEGVYNVNRGYNTIQDTLITWGTRDPNAIGGSLEDWEILQFRGLFFECMGIHHVHSGMIGNDKQQRLWGVLKSRLSVSDWQIGIAVSEYVLEEVKKSRFKTQHEIGESNGSYDPNYRMKSEIEQFGKTGIRPAFGTVWSEEEIIGSVSQYGDLVMILDKDLLMPYVTLINQDSLGDPANYFYPAIAVKTLFKKQSRYNESQIHTLVSFELVSEVCCLSDLKCEDY